MLRLLIEFIFPLLLPTVVWVVVMLLRKDRSQPVPWTWLVAAGVFLAFVVTWGISLRVGTVDGTYHPASIGNGGKLQAGHVDKP